MRYLTVTCGAFAPLAAPAVPAFGRVLIVASALSLAVPAAAQSEPDGNGIKVGETRLFPEIRLDYVSYDNVFRQAEGEVSGSAVQLSPRVRWQADRRLVELEARYRGRYSGGSEELLEFDEHELGINAGVSPNSRVDLGGYATYVREGEELLRRDATPETPVRGRIDVDRFYVGGSLGYGADNARGNLSLGIDIDSYEPDVDNERFVSGRREFVRTEPFARFSLRVSPDTRWLLEARFTDIGYRATSDVDNTRTSLLTGLFFATSGAFGGNFLVGISRIAYEDDFLDDASTARASAALFYAPTSFSRFDLGVGRDFDPRFGGDVSGADRSEEATVITSTVRLDWRYAYSERFYHRASLAFEDNDGDCSGSANITSEREVDAGLELVLRVRRWLELGVGGLYEIDGSDACEVDGVDPDQVDTEAAQIGVHLRAIL